MEPIDPRVLDDLGGRATAPAEVVRHNGWQLRATADAPFRRASSVLALDDVDDLDAALRAVEDFYDARGLTARFQVSPASQPRELDSVLAARGYTIEAPVVVACADAVMVLSRTAGEGRVTDECGQEWTEAYGSLHDDDPASRVRVLAYRRALDRLECPTAAVVGPTHAPHPLALGFAVAERGWSGIFGMGTRPEARRTGAATAVLHTLAAWSADLGVDSIYLQVEVDNAPARSLYARAGFVDAYGYHYRTRGT